MKRRLLNALECPRCHVPLNISSCEENENEIRRGRLNCTGVAKHIYEINNGIIHFATGFDHEAVKKEITYENSTYKGDARLTDERLIAQYPETLTTIWPHIRHFGPDFKALIDHLDVKPDSWILDIGTGPCWTSRLLAQRCKNVVALDVNDANYYGLKTSDIMFKQYDIYFDRVLESMTCLPFKDASMDFITFNASFHHTPDHYQTLKECSRVLKPDGKIAMVNEEFSSLRHRLFQKEESKNGSSHHSIPYSDFEKAAKEIGFKVNYYVANHVCKKMSIPGATALLETFPTLLKQLNSALIILRKSDLYYDKSKKESTSFFRQSCK